MLSRSLGLPVAALPQIDFPTISVQASLPGASPDTMATTVAMPLERSLGRIAGITEMTSSSTLGSTRITLQFDLSRDIDGAARDVQAGINAARALLPTGLPNNPTWRKVNPADAPIMVFAMTSSTHTPGEIYDAASTVVAQKLSQVSGVGQVNVGGGSLPAVRVELNPHCRSACRTVTRAGTHCALPPPTSIGPKVRSKRTTVTGRYWPTIRRAWRPTTCPPCISWNNGAAIRLADVATVTDSVQDTRNAGLANGQPAYC